MKELRAYKRKWIKAFETECELAETAAQNSAEMNAVPREVEETISEIDTAATEVEDCLEKASAAATVEQTNRFSEQIAAFSRRFPTGAPKPKLPTMTLLDYSDADISAQAHCCFTRFIAAGDSSSSEPNVGGVASKPVANQQPAKATPLVHHAESEYADVLMAAPSPLLVMAKELHNATVRRLSPRRVKILSVANTSSASPRPLAGSAQALKMV